MQENEKQVLIDRPKPSLVFLEARNIAGKHIQDQIEKHGGFNYKGASGFRWIKAELSYPSFDHLTLGYKNQIFSILVELLDGNCRSLVPPNMKDRQMIASRSNNLIPCFFPIYANNMTPVHKGWNLIDPLSLNPIDPIELGTDELIDISEWEFNNWTVQVVKDYLKEENKRILSFCDLLGIYPQIWFENEWGESCWILVKYASFPEIPELDTSFEPSAQIKDYKGYFASVSLCFADMENPNRKLYRGSPAFVRFNGLQEI